MLMHAQPVRGAWLRWFLPLEESLRAPLGPALKFSLSLSLSLSVPVLSAVPITVTGGPVFGRKLSALDGPL